MKWTCILVLWASIASAQIISTKVLTPKTPIRIELNPGMSTTLLFPSQISGTFGLGLVSGQNGMGTIQIEHPESSNILVLHPLTESARVLATVFCASKLYVLDLSVSQTPDVAVTFVNADTDVPRANVVTPEEIKQDRIKYNPELLLGLLRRARDNNILQPLYRDAYVGYSKRDAQYTSESDSYRTTVTTIHRFSKEDAI